MYNRDNVTKLKSEMIQVAWAEPTKDVLQAVKELEEYCELELFSRHSCIGDIAETNVDVAPLEDMNLALELLQNLSIFIEQVNKLPVKVNEKEMEKLTRNYIKGTMLEKMFIFEDDETSIPRYAVGVETNCGKCKKRNIKEIKLENKCDCCGSDLGEYKFINIT